MTVSTDPTTEAPRAPGPALGHLVEAVQFARTIRPVMDHHMWVIADYLGRRHGIADLCCDIDSYLAHVEASQLCASGEAEALLLGRLLDPRRTASEEEIRSAGWEQPVMICRALYFDLHPDPEALGAIIRRRGDEPGYSRTHAALALRWVEDHDAEVPGHAELSEQLLTAMAAELDDRPRPDVRSPDFDLFCEQTALIAYLGGPELLQPSWVEHILASQEVDGGWGVHHTTMLALWTLLEALGPSPQPVRWIPPR